MNKTFDLTQANPVHAIYQKGSRADQVTLDCSIEGGRLHFTIGPEGLAGANYLVFEIEMVASQCVCVMLDFWDLDTPADAESDLWVKVGILDNYLTRIVFPLEGLNSQNMFIKPNDGQLKMVVFGKPVKPEHVARFSIGTTRTQAPCQLVIKNLHLTNEPGEYPLPQDDIRVDEIGQYIPKRWHGKCGSAAEMCTYLQQLDEAAHKSEPHFPDLEWDEYGGWKKVEFPASGFFRTQKQDGRWWLVTPSGHAFLSHGIDCVVTAPARITGMRHLFSWLPDHDDPLYGECWSWSAHDQDIEAFDFLKANLIRAFGHSWRSAWNRITRHRLMQWGYNTIGNWSDPEFIADAAMPYVWQLAGFPVTERAIFRDFPDVFSPEYEQNSLAFAGQLAGKRDDPYLIGYFMRNEPTWAFVEGICIAEELLANPAPFISKDRLIEFLSDKYGDIRAFNQAWNLTLESFADLRKPLLKAKNCSSQAAEDLEAFSLRMYRAYNTIPAIACKKADPNHLNLGMRYGYISQAGLVEGWEHFDVFSINSYYVSPYDQVQQASELMDLPIMVGEYHFGSLDSGMAATGLRAVISQQSRADAYRFYVEQGCVHPHFVGAHYFTLYDQPVVGRFDGENYQIGLLDGTHRPYKEITEVLADCHSAAYKVAAGLQKPWDTPAVDVPKVAY